MRWKRRGGPLFSYIFGLREVRITVPPVTIEAGALAASLE